MSIVFTKGDNKESKIVVTVLESEYKNAVDKKIREYSHKVNMKGYRPGKVPVSLVEQLYGEEFKNEELKTVCEKKLNDYLLNADFCTIGSLTNTNVECEGNDFIVEYSIDVMDSFDTNIPNDLKFSNYIVESVPDSIIDTQILSLRIRQSNSTNADSVSSDSVVFIKIEFDGYSCDKAMLFLPNFSAEMKDPFLGKKKGDCISCNLRKLIENHDDKVFFESEEAPELDIIPAKVELVITDIKNIQLVDLDKEKLARALNVGSIESDEQVRMLIKQDMLKKIGFFNESFIQFQLVNAIIDRFDIQLPPYVIDKYVINNLETEEEKDDEKSIDTMIRSLKWSIICSEILHKKNLTLPEDLIQNMMQYYTNELVQYYSNQAEHRLSLPELKKLVKDNSLYIRNKAIKHVKEEFIIDYIKNSIEMVDEKISYDELKKILKKNYK